MAAEVRPVTAGDLLRDVLAALDVQADELAAMRAQLDRIERTLRQSSPPVDERHTAFVTALAESMGDLDLPFTCSEVLAHRRQDAPLAEALKALGITTTTALGTLFRDGLRGHEIAGYRLVRDGRLWWLARTSST